MVPGPLMVPGERSADIVCYRAFTVTVPEYVYKPKKFSTTTLIRDRFMKENEYIIQQIRTGAYDKKHCIDKLSMSEKAWKRYRKHAILHIITYLT